MSKKLYLNGPVSWAEAREASERKLYHVDTVQKRAEDYLVRKAYARAKRNETIGGTAAMLLVIAGIAYFIWLV